jgi:hypothetical protein
MQKYGHIGSSSQRGAEQWQFSVVTPCCTAFAINLRTPVQAAVAAIVHDAEKR